MSYSAKDLPLPEYDRLSFGSLAHRVRMLNTAEVQSLVDYEAEHADRPAVLELLHSRLEELRRGAAPSGGPPPGDQPELSPPPDAGSQENGGS